MDRRAEILEAALALMAREGAGGTSMRAVAGACCVNVATLYHYFPSKRDLLQAAIAHRRDAGLRAPPFPEGLAGPAEDRLAALLDHVFAGMTDDDDFWRALVAEAIHGDEDVLEPLLATSEQFEAALAGWMRDLLPDVPSLREPAVVHALRHALYGVIVEYLPQREGRRDALTRHARQLAAVFCRLTAADGADPTAPPLEVR